jgi:hypothetical protein
MMGAREGGGRKGNRRHLSRYNRCPGGVSNPAYRFFPPRCYVMWKLCFGSFVTGINDSLHKHVKTA